MNFEETIVRLAEKSSQLGYNEAIADCIKIIIKYLKRFENHAYMRTLVTMIGDDIVALKKTED